MLSFEFLEKSPGIVSPPGCDVQKMKLTLDQKKSVCLGLPVPTLKYQP